jgi:urocanate hydratase
MCRRRFDWPHLDALLTSATGLPGAAASWRRRRLLAACHDVTVADGTAAASRRLERVLWDPASGVASTPDKNAQMMRTRERIDLPSLAS